MSLLCSVQTAQDGQLPGSMVLLAVLALATLAVIWAIPALIRANRVIKNAPLPERPESSNVVRIIGGNKP